MLSQHGRVFSCLGQLVPAHVQLFEVCQTSQPLKSHQLVVAGVQKLEAWLQRKRLLSSLLLLVMVTIYKYGVKKYIH